MKVISKRWLTVIATLLVATSGTFAQDYPNKPVRVVVGYVPGGGVDNMARTLSHELSQILGQSFIVDNKPGAGGTIGAAYVAKSPADGYTLLLGETSQLVIAPHIFKGLTYDTMRDFTPLSLAVTTPLVLVANAKTGIKTIPDIIRMAKANPGKLSYGSSGIGSLHHISMEVFKADSGVDIEHIPYKGSGQSITAVVGGELTLLLTSVQAAEPFIKDGKLNLIAVTSAERMREYPNIPSFSEFVKDYDFPIVNGLLAPAGLPPGVLSKLSKAIKQAMESPTFIAKTEKTAGATIKWTTPEEFREYLSRNLKKYERAVKLSNIQ